MARKITGDKVTLEVQGEYSPIPAGKYDAFVYEVQAKTFGPNSKNPGKEYYNVQFRIDGTEYDNRVVFAMIALMPTWGSGADNFMFFQFFSALEGVSQIELRKRFNEDGGIEIPDPHEIEGRLVEITVGIEKNTYQGETQERNTVKRIEQAKEEKALPKITDTVVELEL